MNPKHDHYFISKKRGPNLRGAVAWLLEVIAGF